MQLRQFQVDAFAAHVFQGNPAAIVPLDSWLSDHLMQAIALENNLSETAFFVPEAAEGRYELRWFTPETEVDLCGHATLATAHVLYEHLGVAADHLTFATRSGDLRVRQNASSLLEMDFPALHVQAVEDEALTNDFADVLGTRPQALFRETDCLAVFENEESVARLSPTMRLADVLDRHNLRGLIVTAPSATEDRDFVSRFFAPNFGIPEDPVTGSAHCVLAPFWADKLGRHQLTGHQISQRGGEVVCELQGDRVLLAGRAVTFLQGTVFLPNV